MPTQKHRIILLFNIIKILNKFKILEYHRIQKFTNNTDWRKQNFLSEEKISHPSRFVNKNFLQSWFNKSRRYYLVSFFYFNIYILIEFSHW